MSGPKVLVFTPIYEGKDYCLDRFLEKCSRLEYPHDHIFIDNSTTDEYAKKLEAKGLKVFHIERGATSREALARAQNLARREFLRGDWDYLLSLESDIMVEPDTLTRLLMHGQRVVTALYFIGDPEKKIQVPCITLPEYMETLHGWGTRLLKLEEIPHFVQNGLQRVQAGGFGCCLIERDIVEATPFYYDARFLGHSDIYFFNELFERRIPVYVDTDIHLEHEQSDWRKVADR